MAMIGCFCPNCKEYVFYETRNSHDVLFDNLSTTRFIRHICGNETALQMQATQIKPTEGEPTCAADYNNRGMWQAEREHYDIAISEYNIAIRLSPNDATLYSNRGRAKAALCRQYYDRYSLLQKLNTPRIILDTTSKDIASKVDVAIASSLSDYNAAIRLNPDFAAAYNNRGVAKVEIGQYAEAISDYDIAIQLEPNDAIAHFNRGRAKFELAPPFDDENWLIWAIFGSPDEYDAILRKTDNVNSRRAAYEGAIVDYDVTIRLDPDFANAYFNRGKAKAKLRDYFNAIMDFDTALRLDPNSVEFYYNRAEAQASLGDHEAAISDYDTIISLDPNYILAYYRRGWAKSILQQYESAISDYDVIIQLNPERPLAYYYRGKVKIELEQIDAAKEDLHTALKFIPNVGDDVKLKNKIENALRLINTRN